MRPPQFRLGGRCQCEFGCTRRHGMEISSGTPLMENIQNPICRCGYEREGLASDAPCPECGMLDVRSGERFEGFKTAWAHSTLGPARFAACCGLLSITASLLSVLILMPAMLVMILTDTSFDLAITALSIWLYLALPPAGAGLLIGIISCFCGERKLAFYAMSLCVIAVILPPLLVIGGAAIYNNFW